MQMSVGGGDDEAMMLQREENSLTGMDEWNL
jgi:hypothetical protein